MGRLTAPNKRKTFPALDAPLPKSVAITSDSHSDQDTSDDDSDAPEAETLSGGRAVADAKAAALAQHRKMLQEKRKVKNKAQEAFIQSTKPRDTAIVFPEEVVDEEMESVGSQDEQELNDPVLEARMSRAMRNAEDEEDEESRNEDSDAIVHDQTPASSSRLPDHIFSAAAAAHQSSEQKRAKKVPSKEIWSKRRRAREAPIEQVINGRTLRITAPIDAPPAISPASSRKRDRSIKGGSTFRRKWKKLDALRAQVRSRSGPPRNFATTVQ